MTFQRHPFALAFFLTVALWCSFGFAERVKEVLPDGSLKLESGQNITLAGILVPHDSQPLLSALVAGQEITVEYDKASSSDAAVPLAYIFIKTRKISFPFKNSGAPEESRQMLNRVLLDLGAARVAQESSGKWKEEFLKAESEAQKKGEGIWSYEEIP